MPVPRRHPRARPPRVGAEHGRRRAAVTRGEGAAEGAAGERDGDGERPPRRVAGRRGSCRARDPRRRSAPAARGPGSSRGRVRWYSWSVFAVAVIAGVVFAVSGSPLPSVWPVMLLGAIVALSLNQFAFFPSEWSATAEAAVLVAAVGRVRRLGGVPGPGGRRVAVRAARHRALAPARVLAHGVQLGEPHDRGAVRRGRVPRGVHAVTAGSASSSPPAQPPWCSRSSTSCCSWGSSGSAVSSRCAPRCVKTCSSTVSPCRSGSSARWRDTSPPKSGWWAGALVLLPVPFAPELVLVRARRVLRRTAASASAASRVADRRRRGARHRRARAVRPRFRIPACSPDWSCSRSWPGSSCASTRATPISPMVATLVVVAVVVGGDAALAGAVVVAVIATGTAWVLVQGAWVVGAGARGRRRGGLGDRVRRATVARRCARGGARVRARRRHPDAPDRVDRAVGVLGDRPGLRMGGDRRRGCAGVRCRRARNGCHGGDLGRAAVGESRARAVGRAATRIGAHRAVVSVTGALSFGLAIAAVSQACRSRRCSSRSPRRPPPGSPRWRWSECASGGSRPGDARSTPRCCSRARSRSSSRIRPVAGRGEGWSVAILGGALGVCAVVAWPIGASRRRGRRGVPRHQTPKTHGRDDAACRLPRRLARSAAIDVDAPIELGRWRWFAIGLFAVGAAIGAALIISGQPLPQPAPVLVLAVFVVFAVNRFAFFPTELAVTAEAAVLVAAVVAFRHDSRARRAVVRRVPRRPARPPALAAALVRPHGLQRGEPDGRHARRCGDVHCPAPSRSTSAYCTSAVRRPAPVIAGAALGASLVFALVEGAVGVVLVRLRNGESWPRGGVYRASRWKLLTVPLAMVGASAGYLATEVGWWAAALVLAPTLFVPELALAPVAARHCDHTRRGDDRSRRGRRRRARAPRAASPRRRHSWRWS